MELVNYLRIVRRRWRLVAVFLLLGMVIGAGSALLSGNTPKGPGPTYYLAKHTLSSSDGSANLSRDAALCTEGVVPKRVATKLGMDNPQALAAEITCESHPETNLLYIAAADTDPKRAVLVADTFAEQLVAYLRDVGEQLKQTKIDQITQDIQGMQDEYASLQAEIDKSTDKTQIDLDRKRQTDLASKINTKRDAKIAADSAPATAESLTTLNTAEAVAISRGAYESLITNDPSKNTTKGNSPTQNATRQSAIDASLSPPSGLTLPMRSFVGAAIGLLLGLALVIVLDRVDPRIRTKLEAEEAFGWPVIGEIPPLTRYERNDLVIFGFDESRSRSAEAYRVLRSALLFAHTGVSPATAASPDEHPIFGARPDTGLQLDPSAPQPDATDPTDSVSSHGAASTPVVDPDAPAVAAGPDDAPRRGQVIMVSSPGPSEGKTTTAANMAAILAETGRSVLVVNCDFRRPRIHLHLGGTDAPREVLDTKIPGVKLVTQVLDNPNEANPALVVQTQRQVIRNARDMFDIVLLDTAPLLTTNDATEVLQVADQVVIVAKAGKTHKEAADRAAELLERRNAPVLGVVLVGATDVPTSRYYYYGDNPETEEPEPGTETTNPFDALVTSHGTPAEPTPPDEAATTTDHVFAPSNGQAVASRTGGNGTASTEPTADPSDTDGHTPSESLRGR